VVTVIGTVGAKKQEKEKKGEERRFGKKEKTCQKGRGPGESEQGTKNSSVDKEWDGVKGEMKDAPEMY